MNTTTTLAMIAIASVAMLIGFGSDQNHMAFAEQSNGTKCSPECEPPTLGVSQVTYQRLVSNGFCYNGQCVDAESYYTPFPLIITTVDKENTAVVRIYDNEGVKNIRHVSFGFGIQEGTFFGSGHTFLNFDVDHNGIQTISKTDPNNAIKSFSISTRETTDIVRTGINVLEVTFKHTFAKELPFNIVSVYSWDSYRNGWQTYFNDGVQVIDPNKPIPIVISDDEKYQMAVKDNLAKTTIPEKQAKLKQEQQKASELFAKLYHIRADVVNEPYNIDFVRDKNPHDRNSDVFKDRMLAEHIRAEQTLKQFVSAS